MKNKRWKKKLVLMLKRSVDVGDTITFDGKEFTCTKGGKWSQPFRILIKTKQ